MARTLVLLWCLMAPGLRSASAEDFSLEDAMRRLGHAEFKTRVEAQSELSAWGKENLEEGIRTFYKSYRSDDDPEIRARCRELLRELVIISQSGEGKGYIGIMMQEDQILVPGGRGGVRSVVRVSAVLPGTPAENAKLRVGDLVTGIDELDLKEEGARERFGAYVQSKSPKTTITLHVLRAGKGTDVEVELMRRPPIAERNFLLWGEDLKPPSREEAEEAQFKDWLKERRAVEKKNN